MFSQACVSHFCSGWSRYLWFHGSSSGRLHRGGVGSLFVHTIQRRVRYPGGGREGI